MTALCALLRLCAPPGEQLPHRVHLAVLALVKFCRAMHLFSETKTSKQALDYMLRGTEVRCVARRSM